MMIDQIGAAGSQASCTITLSPTTVTPAARARPDIGVAEQTEAAEEHERAEDDVQPGPPGEVDREDGLPRG